MNVEAWAFKARRTGRNGAPSGGAREHAAARGRAKDGHADP